MLRELGGAYAFLGQGDAVVHFGLGAEAGVGQVRVRWAGGELTRWREVAVDQRLRLEPLRGELQK